MLVTKILRIWLKSFVNIHLESEFWLKMDLKRLTLLELELSATKIIGYSNRLKKYIAEANIAKQPAKQLQ